MRGKLSILPSLDTLKGKRWEGPGKGEIDEM